MRHALLAFLLFFSAKMTATHIVGGEITYQCLGNDQYRVTLTVYRDCYNGQPNFDNPAIVGVYDASWALFKKLALVYNPATNDTLEIQLSNPCLVAPPDVCVHRAVYTSVVSLPFKPGGYTLVYQRCCRNRLIRNLPDPLNTGISFIAQVTEQAMLQCNNSATFDNWPPVAICAHQPIDFDHGATDPDGDSLVYRLCTPLNGPDSLTPAPNPPFPGPYLELNWLDPPYNLSNMLGGEPLSIDAATGFMTGIPNLIGNYVVGVCVDEYRNDTLIATTRRDFQYNVAACGQLTAAFFTPNIVCDTLRVELQNTSPPNFGYAWYFDWQNDATQFSTDYSPQHIYADTGTYTIALIAAPGTICSDTAFQEITLAQTDGTLTVTADPAEITFGNATQLEADLPGASQYTWQPAATLSNVSIFNPVATPSATTTYNVTATLPNGCEKQGFVSVTVLPSPCEEPFLFFPTGFSPNGDGENEQLKLESSTPVEVVYWAVFNRWGEKVFEANALGDAWDGTFRGKPQPMETYGYYLRVRCVGGQEKVKKGNVTLLR
jgi:gliding motility-associated-like protein